MRAIGESSIQSREPPLRGDLEPGPESYLHPSFTVFGMRK